MGERSHNDDELEAQFLAAVDAGHGNKTYGDLRKRLGWSRETMWRVTQSLKKAGWIELLHPFDKQRRDAEELGRRYGEVWPSWFGVLLRCLAAVAQLLSVLVVAAIGTFIGWLILALLTKMNPNPGGWVLRWAVIVTIGGLVSTAFKSTLDYFVLKSNSNAERVRISGVLLSVVRDELRLIGRLLLTAGNAMAPGHPGPQEPDEFFVVRRATKRTRQRRSRTPRDRLT